MDYTQEVRSKTPALESADAVVEVAVVVVVAEAPNVIELKVHVCTDNEEDRDRYGCSCTIYSGSCVGVHGVFWKPIV